MTEMVTNARELVKEAGGEEVGFKKVIKDKDLGELDFRGDSAHVLSGQSYVDDKGVERQFVQLKTGGVVAVPSDVIKRKSRGFSCSHIAQSVWDSIFGRKKRNKDH
jgi:hypothetical protein